MREAHAHIASLGQSLSLPRLDRCRSVPECLDLIRATAVSAPRGNWIRLTNARIESWEDHRWPTLQELDRAAPQSPCVIMSFDHHAAVANTAALKSAGLRAGEPVPPNGVVCVDEHGKPTGELLEQAAYRAWSAAPEPTAAERRDQVIAALKHLDGFGYREVHDLHSQEWLGPLLGTLDREGLLQLAVSLYPPADRLAADAAGRVSWETSRVRLAGGKLFADGTLNSRTAWMLTDLVDPLPGSPRGRRMLPDGAIDQALATALSLGLGIAVHAIGDAAVRDTLDSWERLPPAVRRLGGGNPMPLRIEHCELIDETDVPRFARLGVVCSVQPCHLLADVEALQRSLPHRLHRVLPLRELLDAGCRPGELLLFGSDVPIVGADPGDSIQAAVHRRRPGAPPSDAIAWDQRISEAEARDCFQIS